MTATAGPGRPAPIYHCPFCAEEDLRPGDGADTWECRACLRTFSVRLIHAATPGEVSR